MLFFPITLPSTRQRAAPHKTQTDAACLLRPFVKQLHPQSLGRFIWPTLHCIFHAGYKDLCANGSRRIEGPCRSPIKTSTIAAAGGSYQGIHQLIHSPARCERHDALPSVQNSPSFLMWPRSVCPVAFAVACPRGYRPRSSTNVPRNSVTAVTQLPADEWDKTLCQIRDIKGQPALPACVLLPAGKTPYSVRVALDCKHQRSSHVVFFVLLRRYALPSRSTLLQMSLT